MPKSLYAVPPFGSNSTFKYWFPDAQFISENKPLIGTPPPILMVNKPNIFVLAVCLSE
jgi:hypothetical protein